MAAELIWIIDMPFTYTEEQREAFKDEICQRIAEGITLRSICREEGMPSWRAVYSWLEDDKDFEARFARSRRLGFDAIAEEAYEIANTPHMGQTTTAKEWGDEIKTEDMLGHRKLQIETRLKLLAKWDPKRYGEKVDHTSSDGSMSNQPTRIELVAPGAPAADKDNA